MKYYLYLFYHTDPMPRYSWNIAKFGVKYQSINHMDPLTISNMADSVVHKCNEFTKYIITHDKKTLCQSIDLNLRI